jgi:hypothetical protein
MGLLLGPDSARTPGLHGGQSSSDAARISVAFAGDLSLGGRVNTVSARRGPDAPLAAVTELRDADIAIANLESALAAHGESVADKSQFVPHYFRARPETLAVLEAVGLDAALMANNHVGDAGRVAILTQHDRVTSMGIAAAGAGANRHSACAPSLLRSRELTVAIFAIDVTEPRSAATVDEAGTCHIGFDDEPAWEALGPQLADAHQRAHVVLVGLHWGEDFQAEPTDGKRRIGRRLIELGADAVLGSNAHVIQGVEVHQGRPILHDAGHILVDFAEPEDAGLFHLTLTPNGVTEVALRPFVVEDAATRRATPVEAERILGEFARKSLALGTTIDEGHVVLDPPEREGPSAPAPDERNDPGPPPRPIGDVPTACIAPDVPDDAAIEPIAIGPLTLIGIRVRADRLVVPSLVWVETYWRVDGPVERDLYIRGSGLSSGPLATGWDEFQEPCGWSWPTSRWRPGLIYRDQLPMRPTPDVLRPGPVPRSSRGWPAIWASRSVSRASRD